MTMETFDYVFTCFITFVAVLSSALLSISTMLRLAPPRTLTEFAIRIAALGLFQGLLSGIAFMLGYKPAGFSFAFVGAALLIAALWLIKPPRLRKRLKALGYKARAALYRLTGKAKPSPLPNPI
jgi:hypothetical protein